MKRALLSVLLSDVLEFGIYLYPKLYRMAMIMAVSLK